MHAAPLPQNASQSVSRWQGKQSPPLPQKAAFPVVVLHTPGVPAVVAHGWLIPLHEASDCPAGQFVAS
jgi:hypothetical protein